MERAKMVNDFLALIAELWDVEQFNMWNPAAHSSLAYLIDRSFDDEDYNTKFERWLYLAQDKNAVELTWVVSQAIVQACMKDERISQNDKEYLSALLECQRINYEDNCTAGYVQVKEEYVPEWFFWIVRGLYSFRRVKKREYDH